MWGFPGSSADTESPCNAGAPGWIPGSGRSPGEGIGNPSSVRACRIPWTDEAGGPQSVGSQRVGHDGAPEHSMAHRQRVESCARGSGLLGADFWKLPVKISARMEPSREKEKGIFTYTVRAC